jgi:hypothetical protein
MRCNECLELVEKGPGKPLPIQLLPNRQQLPRTVSGNTRPGKGLRVQHCSVDIIIAAIILFNMYCPSYFHRHVWHLQQWCTERSATLSQTRCVRSLSEREYRVRSYRVPQKRSRPKHAHDKARALAHNSGGVGRRSCSATRCTTI